MRTYGLPNLSLQYPFRLYHDLQDVASSLVLPRRQALPRLGQKEDEVTAAPKKKERRPQSDQGRSLLRPL